MGSYEYKVINAPTRGARGPGVKGPEGRFAYSLEQAINEMAAEGWEYQRAETLPSEEGGRLGSSQTVYRTLLVFRRRKTDDLGAYDPRMLDAPAPEAPPLLLPTPASHGDDTEDAGVADDHGLSALLRRRAARLVPSVRPVDPTGAQTGMAEAQTGFDGFPTRMPAISDDDDLAEDFYGSDTLEFSDRSRSDETDPMDESFQSPRSAAE